ncbi:UvrD-helicase domain-containing protein [Bacillus paramobilis]|uniref:UvrD-helicase domain-containing protein n=1 Tax=Bacillus paramobilis TaxID=2817477 RepID=A0ABZ2VKE2_9BACI
MKVTRTFIQDIPIEKKKLVLRKIKEFESRLLESRSLADIPGGFWIRKVYGTEIYKFRINTGDRILFKYIDDTILFISFQKHDTQIRAAKAYKEQLHQIINLQIDEQQYEQVDEQDEKTDLYIAQEAQIFLANMQQEIVIEDEYIALFVEENDLQKMYYLSSEQYGCLMELQKPVVVFGCAGSGKTMIAIQKCLLNKELGLHTVYMTNSNAIINKTKSMFEQYSDTSANIEFITFRELCALKLNIRLENIIQFKEFYKWIEHNAIIDKAFSISVLEIWIEINTLIKGEVYRDPFLKKEDYFNNTSLVSVDMKQKVYKIAEQYQQWLNSNGYYDDNDVATMLLNKNIKFLFDYFIYDEVQELSKRQLKSLMHCIQINNMMLLGDVHQCIYTYHFNMDFLKKELFEKRHRLSEHFIDKNYRNPFEIVEWINKLKELASTKFKSYDSKFMLDQIAISFGSRPYVVHNLDNVKQFFEKVDHDINSIIIVADEHEKEVLQQSGLAVGRVFTISEVRGLEYRNVYTYNIMTHYKDIWEKTLKIRGKAEELYRVYYNMLYIVVTRAKSNIYFLENESTVVEELLSSYFNYDENLIFPFDEKEHEASEWLVEALKLQKLEKYEQAAKAFEKAGDFEQAKDCLQAFDLQLNYNYGCEQTSYITIQSNIITQKQIIRVLRHLKETYNVMIGGYLQIYVMYLHPLQYRIDIEYISPDYTLDQVAQLIMKSYSRGYVRQNYLALRVHFRQENEIINLSDRIKNGEGKDLSFTFERNQFDCRVFKEKFLKELDDAKDVERQIIKQLSNMTETSSMLKEVQTRKKYEESTSQGMLDFLRGGKL